MEYVYIITGITGFLGRTVAKKLLLEKKTVIGLKLPGDNSELIPGVTYASGDVTKPETLEQLAVLANGRRIVFIHCAAVISIQSKTLNMHDVNVGGVKNILAFCRKYDGSRLIHVSSVHAIPESPKGTVMTETKDFSPELVVGNYAKTKAEATALVLQAASEGLNASVVHPSGIIGPDDTTGGYLTETIRAFVNGKFPCAVTGGYDFVDVRDVADGVISCIENGRPGENYILSGRFITIKELFRILSDISGRKAPKLTAPLWLVRLISPIAERIERATGSPILITPYSTYTLGSNGLFSHDKASRELGYNPRPIEETLRETVEWIKNRRD
ncbi:MAG: NAD-dependent epimerase/dehydratase family protein [Oscillospiraceae bacterium]|nr:NAD-dependent epimerase/dehydratase family protein [Oscillospiraceae bacterium]